MTFDGSEGKRITTARAKKLIAGYQSMTEMRAGARETKSVVFGKDLLLKILGEKHCVGIRFHFARDGKRRLTLVLSGVKKDGRSIPKTFGNDGPLCPPYCG